MINHFRTVLRNSQRQSQSQLGAAYIPATYKPKPLSGTLRKAHAIIFGTQPDGLKLDYRLRELLTAVAATPLQAYVTEQDPRITYDLRDPVLFSGRFGASHTFRTGWVDIVESGVEPTETPAGQLEFGWRFGLLGNEPTMSAILSAATLYPVYHEFGDTVEFVDGISAPYTLRGTQWTHVYSQITLNGAEYVSWVTDYRARPAKSAIEICAALNAQISSDEEFEIFRHSDEQLLNIWRKHPSIDWKLGSFCVALVHAIEQAKR